MCFLIGDVLGFVLLMIGGVAYLNMCGFSVDWLRLCFGFMCYFVYSCVLFGSLYIVVLCFLFLVISSQLPMRHCEI